MKVKTSELTGHALDWAVAKCEEPRDNRLTVIRHEDYIGHPIERETEPQSYTYVWWSPSRIWAQGGPIIKQKKISIIEECDGTWMGSIGGCTDLDMPLYQEHGHTQLVAAMRCYVASEMGDEVDVPDELGS
jgi:hypothetical protein